MCGIFRVRSFHIWSTGRTKSSTASVPSFLHELSFLEDLIFGNGVIRPSSKQLTKFECNLSLLWLLLCYIFFYKKLVKGPSTEYFLFFLYFQYWKFLTKLRISFIYERGIFSKLLSNISFSIFLSKKFSTENFLTFSEVPASGFL